MGVEPIEYVMQCAAVPAGVIPAPSKIHQPKNVAMACMLAGITVEQARGLDRTRSISWRRQHAMWIMRSWGRASTQIGRAMNRDHSTVLHGVKAHQRRMRPSDVEMSS